MPMSNSERSFLKNVIPAKHSLHLENLEMASVRCDLNRKDDPWRVSAFLSAFLELILSILLLLGAIIAFLTSQLVKYFDLSPPCTYIGCTHGNAIAGQRRSYNNRHKGDEFYSECHTSLSYSKLPTEEHSCIDGSDDTECCHRSGRWNSNSSLSSLDSRKRNQLKRKGVDEAYLPLVCTRHSSEPSNSSDGEDYRRGSIMTNYEVYTGSVERLITDVELQRFDGEDNDGVLRRNHVMPMEAPYTFEKGKQVDDGASLPKSNSESMTSSSPVEPEGIESITCLGLSMKEGLVQELIVAEDNVHNVVVTKNFVGNLDTTTPGLNLDVEDLHDPQRHKTKVVESVLVTTCSKSDDNSDEHGQGDDLHESGDVGKACTCVLHNGCAHTTHGPCNGEGNSKPSLERIIQEALDHYLTSFRGSRTEDMQEAAGKRVPQVDSLSVEESMHEVPEKGVAYRGENDGEEDQEVCLEALKAERETLEALEAELEKERNAAAIATSESMAMISRLQEEKSTLQMEVAQLQRMSEERADYDEQAMALLKEILLKREKEKHTLEKELKLYRERFHTEKTSSVGRGSKDLPVRTLDSSMILQRMEHDGRVKALSLSEDEGETAVPIFSTHEEEREFILGRLWVLEEELHGKSGSTPASPDGDPVDGNDQSSLAEPSCAECVGDGDDENAQKLTCEYDVFEETSLFANHGRCQEFDVCPRRMSPKHCNSDIASYPTENCGLDSHHRFRTVSEGWLMQSGVIQQLATRLQALEADRGLLREILESVRQRDVELRLLDEIVHHLQFLRMVGDPRVFTGQAPFSRALSKICATAIKKRRYCNGPGQPPILLVHQRSI